MHNINNYIVTFINQGAGQFPVLDGFFVILTTYAVYIIIALVLLYVIIYPFVATDPLQRLHRIGAAAETGLSLAVTLFIATALKVLVAEPRPYVSISTITQLVHTSPLVSFPSSHAALTMATAIAVLPYHKHLGHLLIAFSFVVSLSRLYVGVHYPFDIGVGLLIGYAVPKLIHRVFAR